MLWTFELAESHSYRGFSPVSLQLWFYRTVLAVYPLDSRKPLKPFRNIGGDIETGKAAAWMEHALTKLHTADILVCPFSTPFLP